MKNILIYLIRFYAWVMTPYTNYKEKKRIAAKMAKLRERDNFTYPTY